MDEICPKVSIVVPVYAGEQTLKQLIQRCESIREQESGRFKELLYELVFVFDEPIDHSQQILNQEASQRDWIQAIPLACNCGQHMATAVGILYSSGDWILTMDEDLQHPPEILPDLLLTALRDGYDLLYVKSTMRVHSQIFYRDLTSRASKLMMRLFTRHDYSIISSMRLVRGELARSMATSIDTHSYLDASLFAVTSPKRRKVYHAPFTDTRDGQKSGYNFLKLLSHYSRFILSAEPSGLRLLLTLLLCLILPVLFCLVLWLLMAISSGTTVQSAPGWLSLFFLGISIHIFLLGYFIFALKMLSILLSRSNGLPPFMVISRSDDSRHLAYLQAAIAATIMRGMKEA